jgi:hypothetical protein
MAGGRQSGQAPRRRGRDAGPGCLPGRPTRGGRAARAGDRRAGAGGVPAHPSPRPEVLVWTQVEPYGQYRAQPAAVPAAAHVPGGSGPDSAGGLRVWAASFARARGIAEAELRVEPPLHPEELAGLELAVGAGLVTIEDDGSFRMVGAVEGKGPYNLFSRGVRVALNREYLIQIAAFAELVLRHRWPARRGGVRVRRLRPGGLCPGWVAGCMGEAKRDQRLLDAMLAELLSISRLDVEQATTNAARKAAALVGNESRPRLSDYETDARRRPRRVQTNWPAQVGCLVGPDGSRKDRLDDHREDQRRIRHRIGGKASPSLRAQALTARCDGGVAGDETTCSPHLRALIAVPPTAWTAAAVPPSPAGSIGRGRGRPPAATHRALLPQPGPAAGSREPGGRRPPGPGCR